MEIQREVAEILAERGVEGTWSDIGDAAAKIASTKMLQGFRKDPQKGLYIEERAVKAMIRESASICFEWQGSAARQRETWGVGKSARSFIAERVFVEPGRIYLNRQSPDDVEQFVGHVNGPQGPRSTLGYHEVCLQPELSFELLVLDNAVPREWWPRLWSHAEQNGLGALRSQGYGKFAVTEWTELQVSPNGKATGKVLSSKKS